MLSADMPASDLPATAGAVASPRSADSFLSAPELRQSPVLAFLYSSLGSRLPASIVRRLAIKWEGGEPFSHTLRRLLWDRYGVAVEALSYGAFHQPGGAESGLRVGRYASIAQNVLWGFDHPTDRIATSAMFYQPRYGLSEGWKMARPTLEICADAWIGAMVVITPGCRRIGIGAVVGAGSVVTADVPDFAIVVGSPARVRRFRFDETTRERILKSRWWERSPAELSRFGAAFIEPVASSDAQGALTDLASEIQAKPR